MIAMAKRTFAYTGCSMRGTLQMGDLVHVNATPLSSMCIGDIVVFLSPNPLQPWIIHRVRKITPTGLVTQGDNCLQPDSLLVTEETIQGRVTSIERHATRKRISNGRQGQLRAAALRTLSRIRSVLYPVSHPLYTSIGEWIIMLSRWRPHILTIYIATESGQVRKYICRGKTVARWKQNTDEWVCFKPYDLVLKKPKSGVAK